MTHKRRPLRPLKAPPTHAERALQYAKDIVAKKLPACKWHRLACKRFLDDLERAKKAPFPYTFDPTRANRACRFAELFPHVKGHWAIPQPGNPAGNLLRLEDWQAFIKSQQYGWVHKKTGFRRFRQSYEEIPRKNAKSTKAATDGLTFFADDSEWGAEVYSGATKEKQAWEVFRPALQMAKASADFREHYGVLAREASIAIPDNGSRFEPVVGKPGDGSSPNLAIVDEYHEHDDDTLVNTMQTGMGARQQPMLLVITTAGENLEGPCYAMHEQATKVLERTLIDEEFFAIIFSIDEGDDWTTEAALRKANPNYDVSVSGEYLKRQQQKAIDSAREQGIFKTKHLNVWVAARNAWLNMEWWQRQADPSLQLQAFKGQQYFGGLDLANKIDVAANVKLFWRLVDGVEHWYFFSRFYVPEKTIVDPRYRHYQKWLQEGHLIATDGDEIDQERIKADVLEDAKAYSARELAFDDWGATKLVQELLELKLPCVRIPQNAKHFSDPMKSFEAACKAGRLHHDGNPMMTWMISNVVVKEDANDNIFPRKVRPEAKIDGPVAAFMALSRYLSSPPPKESVYKRRGLISV
jgi:phage terminase large subunit-like protein